MYRIFPTVILGLAALIPSLARGDDAHQFYEVRSYLVGDSGDPAAIDQFLEKALLPALDRQNIGPVGVFTNSQDDESGSQRIVVVIPYTEASQIASVKSKIDADEQYQTDAEPYLQRKPGDAPYQRIESELLVSMDCMRQLHVPEGSLTNADRVYELRVYESANERLGNLKVDMFNAGEVPIFLDCGIQPVFIGQALVGPFTPNLTYLTMYEDEEARNEAWKAFRVHPDWNVLKQVEKYKGTVSKIHKFVLVPTSYSQM